MSQQSVNVTFLGTGCDYSYPDKESTCILIERGNDRILLDCCPGILRQLTAINREPPEIQTVFISHMHVGHFLGFPLFFFGNVPKGRTEALKVIVPEGKKERILHILEWTLEGIAGKGIVQIPTVPFTLEIKEVSISEFTEIRVGEDIKMRTTPVEHGCDCIGCSIEFKKQGMKIAYSGDTKPCDNIVSLAKDADMLIHEAFFEDDAKEWAYAREHATVRQAAEIAKKANVKILVLIHSHWTRYNRKNIAENYIAEAREVFDGEVLFPSDLDKIDLLSYHTIPYSFPSKLG